MSLRKFHDGFRLGFEQASLRWAARIQDEQKAKELLAKANDQCTEQLVAAQKEVVELKQKLAEAEHKAVNAVGADEKLHNENAKLRERVTQIENDAQIRHAQLLKCSDDVERLEAKLALAVEARNAFREAVEVHFPDWEQAPLGDTIRKIEAKEIK